MTSSLMTVLIIIVFYTRVKGRTCPKCSDGEASVENTHGNDVKISNEDLPFSEKKGCQPIQVNEQLNPMIYVNKHHYNADQALYSKEGKPYPLPKMPPVGSRLCNNSDDDNEKHNRDQVEEEDEFARRNKQRAKRNGNGSGEAGFELRIPSISNPLGRPQSSNTLKGQMSDNEAYLKAMQDDLEKQVNKFNKNIKQQQPMPPEKVDRTRPAPTQNLKYPDLERRRLLSGSRRDLLSNLQLESNMNHLKKMMKGLQQQVDSTNDALKHQNEDDIDKNTQIGEENTTKNRP